MDDPLTQAYRAGAAHAQAFREDDLLRQLRKEHRTSRRYKGLLTRAFFRLGCDPAVEGFATEPERHAFAAGWADALGLPYAN